ncbi:hypothetical protein H257_01151 [Aphanomyces astaci]|uniref:HTH myb-type domain-containing protein n=2 Tax=Aphanomyces astaci TaxID=112090 RepID=W4H6Z4_APHAT|nr:hypothetical protein H257_01151 [Aphanomyces astaci]ETV87652.1 hypothetical protein H257_01151 [Aphanomyces astaci]|eukprot:XP_009822515.1 hypothetical protein H257_01151 [Aphanomyces astaci]
MQVPRKMKAKKSDKDVSDAKHHAGTIQFEARQGRERTNSEETAMILSSMCMNSSSVPSDKASLEEGAGAKVHVKREGGEDEDETLINPGTKYIPSLARFDEADRAKYISSYAKFKNEDEGEGWSSDGSEITKRRYVANAANRMKYHATKFISIEELREHFDQPIVEVARFFGICITLMKKVCRRNGIKRWPHRQIRSLTKSISSMEAAMMTTTGAEREKYEGQIQTLKMKRDAVIADPNKEVSVSVTKHEFKDEKMDDMMPNDDNLDGSDSCGSPRQAARSSVAKDDAVPPFILPATRPRPPPQQYEAKGGRWTSQEHAAFLEGIKLFGKNWRRVAQVVGTRNAVQTRTHAQKYLLKTSAHLDLHFSLLNKNDGDEDDDANHAAFLTSLTTHRDQVAPTAPPPTEVVAGMDRLSSLMLKAESMHTHMLESADTIRSPLDALNFSAPLLLSPTSWNGASDTPHDPPGGALEPPLRKVVLGRKAAADALAVDSKDTKKRKVVENDTENLSPNQTSAADVTTAVPTEHFAFLGSSTDQHNTAITDVGVTPDEAIEEELGDAPKVDERVHEGGSPMPMPFDQVSTKAHEDLKRFHDEGGSEPQPEEEPSALSDENSFAHNTFTSNDMREFCPQI